MIGDSCTFGLIVAECFTYPAPTRVALQQMGRDLEVINAGVDGCTSRQRAKFEWESIWRKTSYPSSNLFPKLVRSVLG